MPTHAHEAEPLLFDPIPAADVLCISTRTLWSLTAPRGPIPCVRIGRLTKYDPRDLRAFIDRAKIKGVQHG